MKKWLFTILATACSLFICSLLMVLIFGKINSIGTFIGAAISYYIAQYVFKLYKSKENIV